MGDLDIPNRYATERWAQESYP